MKRSVISYLILQAAVVLAAVLPVMSSPVAPGRDDRSIPLVPYLEMLADKEENLTINDMLDSGVHKDFRRPAAEDINYGYTDSSFWLRFSIDASGLQGIDHAEYFIEVAYPLYDMVEVYVFDSAGGLNLMRAGDKLPFMNRTIPSRNFVFPLTLRPDIRQTVYIRVQTSGAFQLPFTLVRSDYFIQKEQKSLFAFGIFYGILLIMGIASILLFFIEMDRLYLYYTAFIASIILWHASLDGLAFQFLWPGSPWWANKCIPFFMLQVAATTILFTRNYLSMKTTGPLFDRLLVYMLTVSFGVSAVIFAIPYTIAVKAASLYTAGVAAMLLLAGFYYFIRGNRLARFFSGALTVFLFGSIIVALNRYGVIQKNLATDEAQRIGSLIQVIILYFALGERISIIKREKDAAKSEASEAREKYEIIVEESSDMIFSLDDDWNFISSNKAVMNHLKIPPETLLKTNLLDIIYEENETDRNESIQLIRNKLDDFKKAGEPLSFKAVFRSSLGGEPVAMNVRLEYIAMQGKKEILGRAVRIDEDTLLKYFIEEKQQYVIENYILAADEITQRLTRNLARYISGREVNLVRIALREIVINAIEHGNLGLSFNEKTAAIAGGNYFELIEKRRSDPVYSGRRVSVECQIDKKEVKYIVTDEGDGFDHSSIIERNKSDEDPEIHPHGRGIAMTMNIFDSVRYNRKGNQVTMVKSLK